MKNILKFEITDSLETERLLLRKLKVEDTEAIFEWFSNPDLTQLNTWSYHKSIEDTRKFIAFMTDRYKKGELPQNWGIVPKESKRVIGFCGFTDYSIINSFASVGYVVAENYQNLGIATEAMKEVLRFAFMNLGCNRVEADCFPENVPSKKVLKKLGMSYEGLLRKKLFVKGNFHDIECYSILKGEFERAK